MKFTCEKALLVNGLSIASRTVAQKSSIAGLEGIHVHAGEYLYLSGYNLETAITVTVPCDITEYGKCIMPARLFFDIIRKLPDEEVTVTVDENFKVSIRSGIAAFTITAASAEDYPELPDVEYHNAIKLPQRELRDMISGTIFAVSDNQARPIHTGCLLQVAYDSITMVAVDGYRMALRRWIPEESTERILKVVVPAPALKEVEKILLDTDEPAAFTLGRKHILFEMNGVSLVCRTLEGHFLEWEKVLPTDNPIKMVANRSKLTHSIDRVGLIISEKIKTPVRCRFGENMVDFTTTSTIGTAHDVCELSGDGKELEIGFNCRFFLEALKAVPTDEVTLELNHGLSPIVLTPCDGSGKYAYMILPVRLKAD